MARSAVRAALLAVSLFAPSAFADEPEKKKSDDKPASRKKALEDYLGLMEGERETMSFGGLEVTVTVVHDHFVYSMVKELLAGPDLDSRPVDSLKEQVARMAERKKASMGKPAVLVAFKHPDAGPRSFYAFEGKLDDVLRVRADKSSLKVGLANSKGDLPRARNFTLFRPSKSAAFGGGNTTPTMKLSLSVFPDKPFTLELILDKAPKEKAKELEVAVANLIHFSGPGMRDDQVDFDNGASAEPIRPQKVAFPLPLRGPAMPEAIRELMPEWKGE